MRAGALRVKEAGLAHSAQLAQVPPDRLRLAFEQLPPSEVRSPRMGLSIKSSESSYVAAANFQCWTAKTACRDSWGLGHPDI